MTNQQTTLMPRNAALNNKEPVYNLPFFQNMTPDERDRTKRYLEAPAHIQLLADIKAVNKLDPETHQFQYKTLWNMTHHSRSEEKRNAVLSLIEDGYVSHKLGAYTNLTPNGIAELEAYGL